MFAGVKPAATTAHPVQNDVYMSFSRSLTLSYKNLQNTPLCVLSFQNPEEYHSLINFRRNVKCYFGKRKLINSCLFCFQTCPAMAFKPRIGPMNRNISVGVCAFSPSLF